jgi:hypothetical protein
MSRSYIKYLMHLDGSLKKALMVEARTNETRQSKYKLLPVESVFKSLVLVLR